MNLEVTTIDRDTLDGIASTDCRLLQYLVQREAVARTTVIVGCFTHAATPFAVQPLEQLVGILSANATAGNTQSVITGTHVTAQYISFGITEGRPAALVRLPNDRATLYTLLIWDGTQWQPVIDQETSKIKCALDPADPRVQTIPKFRLVANLLGVIAD